MNREVRRSQFEDIGVRRPLIDGDGSDVRRSARAAKSIVRSPRKDDPCSAVGGRAKIEHAVVGHVCSDRKDVPGIASTNLERAVAGNGDKCADGHRPRGVVILQNRRSTAGTDG